MHRDDPNSVFSSLIYSQFDLGSRCFIFHSGSSKYGKVGSIEVWHFEFYVLSAVVLASSKLTGREIVPSGIAALPGTMPIEG